MTRHVITDEQLNDLVHVAADKIETTTGRKVDLDDRYWLNDVLVAFLGGLGIQNVEDA